MRRSPVPSGRFAVTRPTLPDYADCLPPEICEFTQYETDGAPKSALRDGEGVTIPAFT